MAKGCEAIVTANAGARCEAEERRHLRSDRLEIGAMAERISSLQNPRIKDLVRLAEKPAERRERGVILIEGAKELAHARAAGFAVGELYVCPEIAGVAPTAAGATVYEVSRAVFARIAVRDDSGGVIALARPKEATLEGLVLDTAPLVLVLEGVEKPGNLGAILRTADAVGAAAVVVCDPRCDVWNPNVIRASVGTVFTVPTVTTTSDAAIAWLRARGLRIAAATPEGATPLWDAALGGPLALVFGTEHEGLGSAWLAAADVRVQIPMRGHNDSLNVSVAVGVLAYEALRRR